MQINKCYLILYYYYNYCFIIIILGVIRKKFSRGTSTDAVAFKLVTDSSVRSAGRTFMVRTSQN